MNLTRLLERLNENNITLSLKGDELVVQGKREALSSATLALLRENKTALIELINAGEYVAPGNNIVDIPPNLIPLGCEAITPELLPLASLTQTEIDIIVDATPGGAANVQDIYPLAPLQEGMLFHHLLTTEGDVYLSPSLLAFDTRARLDRFLQALQAVIDRHDILRTAVLWEGLSEPVQVVWRRAPLVVEEVSLDPSVSDVADELYARFDPRRYRLDVCQAPLMRAYIAHDALKDRWLMLHLFHHLSVDHITFDILLEEIQARLLGRAEQSPAPPPFRNFVAQARLGMSREEHESFFREMLWDVDEPTAPYGLIDVQGDGSGIRNERREVNAVLTGRLRQTSRALGVSTASLCHLAWALVLRRVSAPMSRRDDVVFGTVLFGRLQGIEGADRALGMLINTLPVRIRVCEKSVEESVRQTHQLLTKLMRHEHAPLMLAQRCSGVKAPAPLFTALLSYRHSQRRMQANAAPAWEGIESLASEELGNYPLVLAVDDLGDGLALTADTAAQIDPWRICDYMHTALEGLVEALECAPETAIRKIEVMPEAERRQVVEEWNATEADYPGEKLIHQLFEEQADRAPDRVAGVDGDVAISYGELNRRANQLGNYLKRKGAGVESRVGICLERGVEMLVGLLGILKAGGTYMPLDPAYPVERLKFMLEDSSVRLIVAQEKTGRLLGATAPELIRIDSDCDEIGREDDKNIEGGIESENLAYVIYTSGSTGRPKGAMIAHRSVVNFVTDAVRKFRLNAESRFLQFASLSFDVAVEEIFPVWSVGGGVVLRSDEMLYSYSELEQTIERHGVTTTELPTVYWSQWIREMSRAQSKVPRSLDLVITGDERVSPELLKEWKEHGVSLLHVFGVTEVAVTSIVYPVPADFADRGDFAAIPIGLPMANTEVYLLDGDLRPMPVGISSELYLGGAGVARGYLNRPELSAERFVPSPFWKRPGRRLYKSGDLVRSSTDGYLEFIGRIDNQVKVRGFRLELEEVEAILRKHPGVKQAAVILREDRIEDHRLVAYLTTGDSSASGFREGGFGKTNTVELWPSQGDYHIYDDVLYHAMTSDQVRNDSYKVAINRLVKEKVVVDVGTGAEATLARFCIEGGAKKVYAIELLEESYRKAKALVESLGLEEKIILILGEASTVQLPEKADVCVSELIGTVGSAEGCIGILNDARRLLKDGGKMIPERCVTRLAAVALPPEIAEDPRFTEVSSYYVEKVFEKVGRRFDLRLCIRNFPKSHLMSNAGIFEDLDFTRQVEPKFEREISLVIQKGGRIDGFLLWVNIHTIEDEIVDVLEYQGCFSPVYYPVFDHSIEVCEGDVIRIACSSSHSLNRVKPDYKIEGQLVRKCGEIVPFRYESAYDERSFRKTPFYQKVFSDGQIRIDKSPRSGFSVRDIRAYLSTYLPDYMVPSAFVLMSSLPVTVNGKLDRRALPAPQAEAYAAGLYAAPVGRIETVLAEIWEEVLKLERVGRHDHFFNLGGHSLLAVKVISRLRRALGIEVSVTQLFNHPVLSALAEAVRQAARSSLPPITIADRSQPLPLSFAQQRLWIIDQLNPGSAAYNIPEAVRLEGALNLDALERVINEIVRRHEVLRTRIEMEADEPAQVIDEWEPRRLEIVDLTSLPPDIRGEEVSRRTMEEAEAVFNLSRGPLLRVKVLKLEEEEHVLLYTMHHIVSDAWLTGIMIGEVEALYRAFSAGKESPLEELPIQYADFAVWQRSWLQGEVLENQLAYWRRQLAGKLPVLELPTDRPRPARQSYSGALHLRLLPTALSDSLKAFSLKRHCTLFMTLMAAFKTLMYYLAGQTDICVGTDIANRNHAGTEKLIGFFINQLALRTQLSPNLNFEELLRRVREVILEAFAHQDLPFEKLVEALNPDRDESRTPLFQVKMALHNADDEELSLPGLRLSSIGTVVSAAKFDLLLNLTDADDGLIASLQYNTDLFEERTSARILNRFHTLLERILERPDARLQELVESLVGEDERERLGRKSELESVLLGKLKSVKRRTIRETHA